MGGSRRGLRVVAFYQPAERYFNILLYEGVLAEFQPCFLLSLILHCRFLGIAETKAGIPRYVLALFCSLPLLSVQLQRLYLQRYKVLFKLLPQE